MGKDLVALIEGMGHVKRTGANHQIYHSALRCPEKGSVYRAAVFVEHIAGVSGDMARSVQEQGRTRGVA